MSDFIRDRKNIKWVSMMLTEHRETLQEWGASQDHVEPPDKTEEELAELAEQISWAVDSEVRLTYYRNKRNHHAAGIMKGFHQAMQALYIESPDGMIIVPVRDIVSLDS